MALTVHSKHVILAAIIAIVLLLVSWKIVAHYDGLAHDSAVLAKAQVDADLQKSKIQASQTASDKADLKKQVDILTQSNIITKNELASIRSKLDDQKAKNVTLSSVDLAARWETLLSLDSAEMKPQSDGIFVTMIGARTTVNALEELPALRQEIEKKDVNSKEKDNTISSLQKSLGSTEAELTTCKKTVIDQDDSCKKQIKDIKAQARKHSVWAALGGFVGGLIFDRFKK